jgi:recombination protein RecT
MSAEIATQQQPAKPIHVLTAQLDSRRDNFSLPSTITFDEFKNTLIAACSKDSKLLQADRASLMLACINAAADGLLPNGHEAALVIFNTKVDGQWVSKVQYMPMVAGVLKKLRQSGEIKTIFPACVHEGDEWEFELGSTPKLVHRPQMLQARGPVIFAYARATLKDGTEQFEVLHMDDILKIRDASKGYKDAAAKGKSSIWGDWFEEMCKKSAIRRLAKYLPSSTDVQKMFEREDAAFPLVERQPSKLQALVSPQPEQAPEVNEDTDFFRDEAEGVVE